MHLGPTDRKRLGLLLALLATTTPLAGCIGDTEPRPPGKNSVEPTSDAPFTETDVLPGNYTTDGNFSLVVDEGAFDPQPYRMVNLTSNVDDVRIQLALVLPDVPNGTDVPILLDASPFYSAPNYRTYDQAQFLVENFVSHGYAVAMLARRGTGGSGGCSDPMSAETGADLNQTIDWLADQDWSSGKVGVIGLSADGQLVWQAASTGNPHVETLVPIAGWSSHFDRFYRNGTTTFQSVQRAVPSGPFELTTQLTSGPRPSDPAELQRFLMESACPEADGAVAWPYAAATGQPDPTGYWAQRNLRPEVEDRYDGSVFVVHGLQDRTVRPWNLYPWIHALESDGLPVKHLIGQWAHSRPDEITEPDVEEPHVRWDFAETLLHWFDYWLKGETGQDIGPRVQVEDSRGHWRSEASWPPHDAERLTFNLTPDRTLEPEASRSTGSTIIALNPGSFVDTEPTGPCPGCAVFRTDARDAPLRFAGLPEAHLTVTPLGPGGYLTATLYVVHENGSAQFLTDTDIDLRYADAEGEPAPVTPGQPSLARMQLGPVDAVVPEGSRLALVISQGNIGGEVTPAPGPSLLFDVFQASAPTQPIPVRLELGAGQSTLSMDVFEREAGDFFEPPDQQRLPSEATEPQGRADGPEDTGTAFREESLSQGGAGVAS